MPDCIRTSKQISIMSKVIVVGGAGRIGLPFAIANALAERETYIYDINKEFCDKIVKGELPFKEKGLSEDLKKVVNKGYLKIAEKKDLAQCGTFVITVGTPVDEYLCPNINIILNIIKEISYFLHESILIIRSTVPPGGIDIICKFLNKEKLHTEVVYAPNRAIQGDTLNEIRKTPQIISCINPCLYSAISDFFAPFSSAIVELSVAEAELTKLFTNAYRYIQFATINEFFMLATNQQVDYAKVETAMRLGYPRLVDMPAAGFAAGSLRKDTMFLNHVHSEFQLGKSAVWINENMPNFLVNKIEKRFPLNNKVVGVLGLAFKGDIDDIRDSLACRLIKILKHKAYEVLITDPYIKTNESKSLTEVLKRADLLIIATPHEVYHDIQYPDGIPVFDIWNSFTNKATSLVV